MGLAERSRLRALPLCSVFSLVRFSPASLDRNSLRGECEKKKNVGSAPSRAPLAQRAFMCARRLKRAGNFDSGSHRWVSAHAPAQSRLRKWGGVRAARVGNRGNGKWQLQRHTHATQ